MLWKTTLAATAGAGLLVCAACSPASNDKAANGDAAAPAAAPAEPAAAPAPTAGAPTDPQIAHIAYTAGQIDITAAEQALKKTKNPAVKSFAETMVRDHKAVNEQALALVKKLGVTPEENPTSSALSAQAKATLDKLEGLSGADYDRAYVANEVAYHQTVNGALRDTLIPSASNAELKSLLQTGFKLFGEHQAHAEALSADLNKGQ
jgi:putative membrane protein